MGHLVGDKVLQYFPNMLKKYAEKDQFAAHFGGEEMVMIVFGKSNIEIINVSNKIRVELTESRLKLKKMTA